MPRLPLALCACILGILAAAPPAAAIPKQPPAPLRPPRLEPADAPGQAGPAEADEASSGSLAVTVQVVPSTGTNPPIYHTWLGQNYPNPFNASTIIRYSCASAMDVTIIAYSVTGQKVATLVNRRHDPGNYSLWWNGADDRGRLVPAGVYYYRMTSRQFEQTRKMIFLR